MDDAARMPSVASREPRPTRPEFESFFRIRFPEVARAMMLVAHDRDIGEQLAAESFTRLYERWPSIESEEHALRFTYRAALNLASSHHRSERRWRTLRAQRGTELAGTSVPGPETGVAERAEVFAALRKLSAKQRACVVLVDYVGLDDREAAATLGIAASTVRVHLTRGRRALRAALGGPEEEGS